MTVFYRLTDIPSTNESPIHQDNKFKLNKLCLKSFVMAFREVKPKMVFICDYCPGKYQEMIEELVPFEKEVIFTNVGINGSCLMQYDLAVKSDDDVFLFQECDYLYRPSVGKQMVEAIKQFGLLSPYDHPDFYNRYDIHPLEAQLHLLNNAHYRTAKRNTMTFGMTKEAFDKNKEILKKYGYLDNEVWREMNENGYPLFTPLPGFATHMVKEFMSPAIPWQTLIEVFK